jgi:branched-chain amino acid transport system ATP-binding protein
VLVLQTRSLGKRYGSFQALSDIDLNVRPKVVHALIGPNGAGKSTLLHLLAGTVTPSTGAIAFEGADITSLPVHRRARLGISRSYQVVHLFEELTCLEAAKAAVQRDVPVAKWLVHSGRRRIEEAAIQLLDRHGLSRFADKPTTSLAHGLQKRLEIALSLANRSSLLLLDEPAAGLTAHERTELASMIRSLARERAVVIVEHDIDMVMSIADRISVLHNGRLIAEGSPEEIKADRLVREVYLHTGETQHA